MSSVQKKTIILLFLALFFIGNLNFIFSKDPCPFHDHSDRSSVAPSCSHHAPVCRCFWSALFLPCSYDYQGLNFSDRLRFYLDTECPLHLFVSEIMHPPQFLSI